MLTKSINTGFTKVNKINVIIKNSTIYLLVHDIIKQIIVVINNECMHAKFSILQDHSKF